MASPLTDPGRLRRRLVLEAPLEVADGAGGITRGFAEAGRVWVEMTALPRDAADAAGRLNPALNWRLRLRARADLTPAHRFRVGARVLRILSISPADAQARFLDIIATDAP
jgi:head-tail adaptor